jgi:hypothetical protein
LREQPRGAAPTFLAIDDVIAAHGGMPADMRAFGDLGQIADLCIAIDLAGTQASPPPRHLRWVNRSSAHNGRQNCRAADFVAFRVPANPGDPAPRRL